MLSAHLTPYSLSSPDEILSDKIRSLYERIHSRSLDPDDIVSESDVQIPNYESSIERIYRDKLHHQELFSPFSPAFKIFKHFKHRHQLRPGNRPREPLQAWLAGLRQRLSGGRGRSISSTMT